MTGINHVRVGSGEPLVLLHGIGSRWQVWEPLFDLLTSSFEVIAVDLPGFGGSEIQGTGTVAELTELMRDFLTELDLDRPHLAGNSMGGVVALSLGAQGHARSVTAFSPIGFWSAPGSVWCRQALLRMHQLGSAIRPALPRILATTAGRTALFGLLSGQPWKVDPHTALDTAVGVLDSPGFHDALRSFSDARFADSGALEDIPVTIAWGSRDILLTYATQHKRARRLLPGARHATLHHCGHVPFFDDPQACARLLLSHARR